MNQIVHARVPRNAHRGPDNSALAPFHRNRPFCRTSEYKPPGSTRVGLSPTNQPSKIVWELDYALNDKQFKNLSERFPGLAFIQTGYGCHDHPVAHTSYRVVWSNVVKLIPAGSLVADVSGNPSFNEGFNRSQLRRNNPIQIDTYCKVLSTKDSIRARTRWGPMVRDGVTRWEEMSANDMYRFDANRDRFSAYDVFLMNHVLYYHDFSEVTKLLHMNPDAILYATMHRLPGKSGFINCGEQSYDKDPVTGKVVQVNVETGEKYVHPDPEPWFNQFAYADAHGAIAWTINKGCDDTYIFTITTTNPRLVAEQDWLNRSVIHERDGEVHVITCPDVAAPPPAYAVEEVVLKTSNLLPGYHEEKTLTIQIRHPVLYQSLRHFMINKPRNAKTLADLTAKAHREVGNNPLVGSKGKVTISPDELTRTIAAAWVAGSGLEGEMLTFAESSSSAANASLGRVLSGKSLSVNRNNIVKQVARFALLAQSVRSAREPFVDALQVLENLF